MVLGLLLLLCGSICLRCYCVIIVRNKDILTDTFVEYQANIIPAVSDLYQKMSKKLFKNEQSKPVSSPNKI